MSTAQTEAARIRLQQLYETFQNICSPAQLSEVMTEAGCIYYKLMQVDQVPYTEIMQDLGKQAHHYRSRPIPSQDVANHCYRLLWTKAADIYSDRQRTLFRPATDTEVPKWTLTQSTQAPGQTHPTVTHETLPSEGIVMSTNWQQDFAEQGQRFALFVSELLAELQSKSVAELRKLVDEWFNVAAAVVHAFRAIRRFTSFPFPYAEGVDRNKEQVLQRRLEIQNELKSESQHVYQQTELLDRLEQNNELMELFWLAYGDIACDFSTGRYGGGRFALTVLHPAARDVLLWLHRVCLRYDFKYVEPYAPPVGIDKIGYREIPPGEEPAEGYYALRRHMHELKQLLQNCPVTEDDLQNIQARLALEQAKILSRLEQRQQNENQLHVQQQLADSNRRLLAALEKTEQVNPQVTVQRTAEVQPQADRKLRGRGKPNADPGQLVDKLRKKIANGYAYTSYKQLGKDIGGASGTWTNIFNAPENSDLQAWKDNRGVYARNNQLAAEQLSCEPEVYIPDDEVEILYTEYVSTLPKEKRQEALHVFSNLDSDKKRKLVQTLSDS